MSSFEGSSMIEAGVNSDSLAKQAKAQELIRFKQEIDGLKGRLQAGPGEEAQLREACVDFEAVFLGKLWQEMQSTIPKEGYLHSNMEQMYLSMFDQPFSEHLAGAGGIGLADMIYDQLSDKLKSTSRNILPGNAEIKPLAENGKAEIKSLAESFPQPTALHPEAERDDALGREELKPVEGTGAVLDSDPGSGKRVDQLSPAEVQARMNLLMREIAQAEGGAVTAPVTVESTPLERSGEASFSGRAEFAEATARTMAEDAWENAALGAEPAAESGPEAGAAEAPPEFLPGPLPESRTVEVAAVPPRPVVPVSHGDEEGEWVSADSLGAGI